MARKEIGMEKEKRSETFYRDEIDLSPEDAERIDMLIASLSFGSKYKTRAQTDMNDIVSYCPDCKFEDE